KVNELNGTVLHSADEAGERPVTQRARSAQKHPSSDGEIRLFHSYGQTSGDANSRFCCVQISAGKSCGAGAGVLLGDSVGVLTGVVVSAGIDVHLLIGLVRSIAGGHR